MPAPSTTINFGVSLEEQCEAIWVATRERERAQERMRIADPVVKLWDAEMALQFVVRNEYSQHLVHPSNDTGTIEITLPFDSPEGQWLWDEGGRVDRGEGRNFNITVEYCGSRIGGLYESLELDLDAATGDQVITATFLTDYERLKWYSCWSNPFFPEWIQWPQVCIIPGPITWMLAVYLDLQVQRERNSGWAVPSDPMDPDQRGDLDQSTYSMVVKPISFIDAMASGVLWGIGISRFKNFHELAGPILDDGECCTVIDIYMEGDPEPWPGANLRHGTRIVSFEDRSGSYSGTAHGGTIWDGLIRTVLEFVGSLIDSTEALVTDGVIPPEYYDPNAPPRTQKQLPSVVWRDGEISGLDRYKYKRTPSKAIQVVTGGHSMPGVVGAPACKGLGHRRSRQSTREFPHSFRWSATSSPPPSSSRPSAARWTRSWHRSTRMPCWRSWSPARSIARTPKAGRGTSNVLRRPPARHTRCPRCSCSAPSSGRPAPTTPFSSALATPRPSSSEKPATSGWTTAAASRSGVTRPAAFTWIASARSSSTGTARPRRPG